ncbi:hypothetical protein NZ698_17760 [Chryseobacterium sp. PBS4-4]|uniref:Lipoprotein n=1 Tax=Chryseobacterium edaphi TaxID=2976532 RepID=A0ABT2WAP0_9FLAO|nr:hypothetical protein [Chryseobacterium edaphi]MCU7619028.1 hypothetical protein [Chryseobacterium edaphi]
MQTNKIIFIYFFIFSLFGCKESNAHVSEKISIKDSLKENVNKQDTILKEVPQSFVVSCGSGCAMTYNVKNVTSTGQIKKVDFGVDTYIDEVLSETNQESYLFFYDQFNKIEKIQHEGEKENILENLIPDVVESFKDFANSLVSKQADPVQNQIQKNIPNSNGFLYNNKINPKTVKYNKLNVNSITGISKFICDISDPRYISLLSKNDIKMILVPQDCGDFSYRYYLLTIKNDMVVSDLYVEGESYEPDDQNSKEVTSFSIDKDYNINVSTKYQDSFRSDVYKISDDARLIRK